MPDYKLGAYPVSSINKQCINESGRLQKKIEMMPPSDMLSGMSPLPLLSLFLASPLLGATSDTQVSHESEPAYVFQVDTDGHKSYRIPALVQAKDGTLLAFAEGRVHHSGDHGDINLVLRRSIDGGKTWGELIIVRDDGTNICGNPAPVVLPDSGKILLISCGSTGSESDNMNKGVPREIYVQESNDTGKTWSEAVNITTQVRRTDWGWFATGPCNAIVIKQGKYKGRIIVPCNYSVKKNGKVIYEGSCFYSDDQGKTWTIGQSATTDYRANESSIAEASSGLLIQCFRAQNGVGQRLLRYSQDGGKTWTKEKPAKAIANVVCQGSLIRDESISQRLYLSAPGTEGKRENITIYASANSGKTWPAAYTIRTGSHGYSNLVDMDSKTLGILYESGRGQVEFHKGGIVFEQVPKLSVLKSKNKTTR